MSRPLMSLSPPRGEDAVKSSILVMLFAAVVMVVASLQTPAALAQDERQQRGPNEGEPKHEINEIQNRLHQTENNSKQEHREGKIDALQELRQEAADVKSCEFPAQSVQLQRRVNIMNTSPRIVEAGTDICGNIISYTEVMTRNQTASLWRPR